MADTTIAAQVHQSLDVHGNGTTQVAFNRILANLAADGFNLGLSQVLDLSVRLDATVGANLARQDTADTIDARQGNLRMLVRCYVMLIPAIRAI
jgi:hypothetical protein